MSDGTTTTKVRCEPIAEGEFLRLTLDAPKGNVLDATMVGELGDAFREAANSPRVKAILLTAQGDHFSFGASVEEHLPEQVEGMLTDFHALFATIASTGLPVLAAVRGACLGGGLELAAFCHRVFAHPGAKLGQPEIKLGVIAPVGSCILAERMGRGAADDLLLTGRTIGAEEALARGLVDAIAEDPEAAALVWAREHLAPLSASSLRFATRAARFELDRRMESLLRGLEGLYLDELMQTEDAVEGIQAFLEKRSPNWSDR